MSNKTIKYLPEKLEIELYRKGLDKRIASMAIGHSINYLNTCKTQGRISRSAANMIQHIYGIDKNVFTVEEKEDQEEKTVKQEPHYLKEADVKVMYEIIYRAVYEAVKKAWSE